MALCEFQDSQGYIVRPCLKSRRKTELSVLQDFPCPIITLGQQEACDWTGKREAEQRAVGTENDSEEGSREGKMEADG